MLKKGRYAFAYPSFFLNLCYKTYFFSWIICWFSRFKVNKGWSTAVLLFLCPYVKDELRGRGYEINDYQSFKVLWYWTFLITSLLSPEICCDTIVKRMRVSFFRFQEWINFGSVSSTVSVAGDKSFLSYSTLNLPASPVRVMFLLRSISTSQHAESFHLSVIVKSFSSAAYSCESSFLHLLPADRHGQCPPGRIRFWRWLCIAGCVRQTPGRSSAGFRWWGAGCDNRTARSVP